MINTLRSAFRYVVAACVLLFGAWAHASTISGPTSSTTGTFTLTWPAGYHLHIAETDWEITGYYNPATSYAFTNLPSGNYTFKLQICDEIPLYDGGIIVICSDVAGSQKTVAVTRDAAPAIDTATTAAGTMSYAAGVSARGSATVSIPLNAQPLVNGVGLPLALTYDSAREFDRLDNHITHDTLGYGWAVSGLSMIQRCRVGISGQVNFESTDRLCLDGEPLIAVSGAYWANNTEYRTERQSFIKVIGKNGGYSGFNEWFEVRYPDGRVGTFDVKVAGGAYVGAEGAWARPPYIWAIRRMVGPAGDEWNASYEIFDGYGELRPREITHANAKVEFKYGPRSDTPAVSTATSNPIHRRIGILNRILVSHSTNPVREYRLSSSADAGGRLRLEKIQECGYARDAASGSTPTCLKPLVVSWATLTGQGTVHYPIGVSGITDGLGAQTQFVWNATTASSNPLAYTEAPFSGGTLPGGTTATQTAIVQQIKTSDGLGGWRTQDVRYKGLAQRSTTNRGLIGFQEMRVQDLVSGWYAYRQQRLDWPLMGAVSRTGQYRYTFGTANNTIFSFAEAGYAVKALFSGTVQLPYTARSTSWSYEQGILMGGSKTVAVPCFRVLNGDGSCPASGTEFEYFTSMSSATTVGHTISSPAFTPSVWGDVPDRTISNRLQVTAQSTLFANTTTPWLLNLPTSSATKHEQYTPSTDTLYDTKTVAQSAAYLAGTSLPQSQTSYVGASGLTHTLTYAYQLNGTRQQVASQTISGSNFASRTVSYTERTVDGRIITDTTYPLGHTISATPSTDTDSRFAVLARQNDPNSRASETDRDSFGRVIRSEDAIGNEVSVTYERCDVATCPVITGVTPMVKITQTSVNNSSGSTQIAPTSTTYLDMLGREVLSEVQAFNSSTTWHRVRTAYDTWGRVQYVTKPFLSTGSELTCTVSTSGTRCTFNRYEDPISPRMTRQDRPDGSYLSMPTPAVAAGSFSQQVIDTILTPGQSATNTIKYSTFDLMGRLQTTQDAYGTASQVITQYTYDAHGNLTNVTVDDKLVARMTYDVAGNMTQLYDSNFGATDSTCTPTTSGCFWSYTYNALGELTTMTDAIGQRTDYSYDLLGRPTTRVDRANSTAVTHTWTWDPQYAVGALASRVSPGFSQTYTYLSTNGLLQSWTTNINPAGVPAITNLVFSNYYDNAWRVTSVRRECGGCVADQPASGAVTRNFTPQGHVSGYTSGATWLQSASSTDAFGNVTLEAFGNGLQTSRGYDTNTGRLTSVQTGTSALPSSIQHLLYTWRSDGALYQRQDMKQPNGTTTDTFTYDALARVTSQATSGTARTLTFSYDKHGNLTGKASPLPGDLSVTGQTYPSPATRPQRLSQVTIGGIVNTLKYDANGSIYEYTAASGDQMFIDYDGDRRVTRVTKGTASGTPTPTARDEFWYDANGDRFLGRQSWMESGSLRTQYTYYFGHYELVYENGNNVSHVTQHSNAVRFVVTPAMPAGRIEYVHADHLGSNTVTTTTGGAVVGAPMEFDPFGGRRAANRQTDATPSELATILAQENERTGRGFTGHEHLNRTGLIHMNGRVYDPRIGRFLSRDPLTRSASFSQSWNRYSYVENRAVAASDPSGYLLQPGSGEPKIDFNGATTGGGNYQSFFTNASPMMGGGGGDIKVSGALPAMIDPLGTGTTYSVSVSGATGNSAGGSATSPPGEMIVLDVRAPNVPAQRFEVPVFQGRMDLNLHPAIAVAGIDALLSALPPADDAEQARVDAEGDKLADSPFEPAQQAAAALPDRSPGSAFDRYWAVRLSLAIMTSPSRIQLREYGFNIFESRVGRLAVGSASRLPMLAQGLVAHLHVNYGPMHLPNSPGPCCADHLVLTGNATGNLVTDWSGRSRVVYIQNGAFVVSRVSSSGVLGPAEPYLP